MASAHTTSSRLLALPDSLLGLVFEELEDGEDWRAFMHTCKHLHDNQECLSKITCVTLFLDESKHGTIHSQLSTVIPGSAITGMEIRGFESSVVCVEQRITFRSPAAQPLLAAFPRSEHQRLLHQITHLELDEMCAIKDAPSIRALIHCLRECMPKMKHLTVSSVADEHVNFLLLELPQLELTKLVLMVAADDLSGQGTGHLLPLECSLLVQLRSLQHLNIIECKLSECNFAPFGNLSRLQSFCLITGWEDDERNNLAGAVGLNDFLAGVPNLTSLTLSCLPDSEMPISQSVSHLFLLEGDMVKLPTRATLPSLLHLESFCLDYNPEGSQAQLKDALDGLANLTLACENFRLRSSSPGCMCAGFLHALSSKRFVFDSVKNLDCYYLFFRSGDLSQLAACFPNLESLSFCRCCFVHGNVAEICDFSALCSCTIMEKRFEFFDEEEVLGDVGEGAYRIGDFWEGLKDTCAAIQAKRHSSLPPLHIELVDVEDTSLKEKLLDPMERVHAMLSASGSQIKVRLSTVD